MKMAYNFFLSKTYNPRLIMRKRTDDIFQKSGILQYTDLLHSCQGHQNKGSPRNRQNQEI